MTDTKPKILLIDDEKMLLDMYSIKFLKAGFDVFACSSADEGLNALRGGYEPNVILFDIVMPLKNGYQFLEEATELSLPRHCLKIALTNESQEGEVRRSLELGADAHLIKARYTPGEVVEEVVALMRERHLALPTLTT